MKKQLILKYKLQELRIMRVVFNLNFEIKTKTIQRQYLFENIKALHKKAILYNNNQENFMIKFHCLLENKKKRAQNRVNRRTNLYREIILQMFLLRK